MCLVLSPPCTLNSGESKPGLELRCPLHLPLSEVQADRRTWGTTSAGVARIAFAGQFCCILTACWDVALCVSACTVPVLWCPVEESAGGRAGAVVCSGRASAQHASVLYHMHWGNKHLSISQTGVTLLGGRVLGWNLCSEPSREEI